MKDNFVSVVTPCYNSVEYIEECILSLKNQTSSKFEHIIIDGGSTDGTIDIIKKYEGTYSMKWISEPDDGMYDAIVKGFSIARGSILAWLNSDDMYQENTIKIVRKIFENPKVKWLTGFPVVYNKDGIMYAATKNLVFPIQIFMKLGYPGKGGCGFQQESTFWSNELWSIAKGENIRNYKYAGDIVLWRKFSYYEPVYVTDAILSGFRKHKGQKSDDRINYIEERWGWNIITVFLKILKIPEFCSNIYALIGKKRFISLQDLEL